MELYTISLPDVTPLKLVTAKATYGIGFLTSFVSGFCALLGIQNNMYTEKIKKAEALAMQELEQNVKSIGADGVMDVRCQIDGLSFLITGTAYKWSAEERAKREQTTKARCEAERRKKQEAEAKREAEEKARRQSIQITTNHSEGKNELRILPNGKGYICPLCGYSNSSFSACAQCKYYPFENLSEETNIPDDEYVDVACPKCGEMLSFLKNEVQGICLECGAEFSIK